MLRPGNQPRPPRAERNLASIAPRLALARDQRLNELWLERAARRRARRVLLKAEQLVAHRDLQLLRAIGRGASAKYIGERERKLTYARRALRGARAYARSVGVDVTDLSLNSEQPEARP